MIIRKYYRFFQLKMFLLVYFFVDHGNWFEKTSNTFYVYTYNRNDVSAEPFIETSRNKEDFRIEYDLLGYDYIFDNGEQIKASFIKFSNGELSRVSETEENKIIETEYSIIYNRDHISVNIDENGVITSSADKICGIVVKVTVKVQNLETSEIKTYVKMIGLNNDTTHALK